MDLFGQPDARHQDQDKDAQDLLAAAMKGFEAPLIEVLNRGDGKELLERSVDGHKRTALHLAGIGGHEACMERILSYDAEIVNCLDSRGQSPLHALCSCSTEEVRAASLLLQAGASGNVRDKKGRTPLHLAIVCDEEDEDDEEEDSDEIGNGSVNATSSAEKGKGRLFRNANVPNPNNKSKSKTKTKDDSSYMDGVSMFAPSRPPLIQVLNLLLGEGTSPDIPDSLGNTPLHLACSILSEPVVFTLLCYGARPDSVNSLGDTPLMMLDMTGIPGSRIARLLAENGADPYLRNKFQWCVLDGPGISKTVVSQLKRGAARYKERLESLYGPTPSTLSSLPSLSLPPRPPSKTSTAKPSPPPGAAGGAGAQEQTQQEPDTHTPEKPEILTTRSFSAFVAGGLAGNRKMKVVWIPDENTALCFKCGASFTVLRRRHHCRRCGSIFCGNCSSRKAVLKDLGYIGGPSRVCDSCYGSIREPSMISVGDGLGIGRLRLPSEYMDFPDDHHTPMSRSRDGSILGEHSVNDGRDGDEAELGRKTPAMSVPAAVDRNRSTPTGETAWDPEASTPQRVAALEMEWEEALVAGTSGGGRNPFLDADTTVERVVHTDGAFDVNRSFGM